MATQPGPKSDIPCPDTVRKVDPVGPYAHVCPAAPGADVRAGAVKKIGHIATRQTAARIGRGRRGCEVAERGRPADLRAGVHTCTLAMAEQEKAFVAQGVPQAAAQGVPSGAAEFSERSLNAGAEDVRISSVMCDGSTVTASASRRSPSQSPPTQVRHAA